MKKSILLTVVLLPFVGVMTSWADPGDEYSREGKLEAFAVGQYGYIAMASVPTYQLGVGVGYNVIDHLNINASLSGGSIGASTRGVWLTNFLSDYAIYPSSFATDPGTVSISGTQITAGTGVYVEDANADFNGDHIDDALRLDPELLRERCARIASHGMPRRSSASVQ